jgi:hypothetical protein
MLLLRRVVPPSGSVVAFGAVLGGAEEVCGLEELLLQLGGLVHLLRHFGWVFRFKHLPEGGVGGGAQTGAQ